MATINMGWLKDKSGEKFAPKTLSSQIVTSDGSSYESKVSNDFANLESKMNGIIVSVPTNGWTSQSNGIYTNIIQVEQIKGTETFDVSLYGQDTTEEQNRAFGECVISVETAKGQVIVTASEPINVLFRILLRGKVDFGEQSVIFVKDLAAEDIDYDKATSKLPASNVQQAIDCLSNVSNPNLLINGDFQVNQRGVTTYDALQSVWSTIYTADRWALTGQRVTAVVENNTLSVISGVNVSYLRQVFENSLNGSYTVTVKVASLTGWASCYMRNSSQSNSYGATNLNVGINYIYINGNDLKELMIGIGENSTIVLEYVKLEQGTIATPFVPRSYAEELAMCERYYQYFSRTHTMKNNLHFFETFNTRMRTAPSFKALNITGKHGDTTLEFNNFNNDYIRLSALGDSEFGIFQTWAPDYIYVRIYGWLDAEIY